MLGVALELAVAERLVPGGPRGSRRDRSTARARAARAGRPRPAAGTCRRTRSAASCGPWPAGGRRRGRADRAPAHAAAAPDGGPPSLLPASDTGSGLQRRSIPPTMLVISHCPSIRATSKSAAVADATSSVSIVDVVALEVQRAAVAVDRDLELVRGVVRDPVVLGLERRGLLQPELPDLVQPGRGLPGTHRHRRVRARTGSSSGRCPSSSWPRGSSSRSGRSPSSPPPAASLLGLGVRARAAAGRETR